MLPDSSLTNLPKGLLDKCESLFRSLLGEATHEVGGIIADQVRYARLRNQLKILSKTDALIKNSSYNVRPVDLKVLVPLIETCSLEEDENIQDRWASMLANLATLDSDSFFNNNCVEVFGRLSPDEIAILDFCYEEYIKISGPVVVDHEGKLEVDVDKMMFSQSAKFTPFYLQERFGLSDFRIRLYTENLTSLGLLQFEEIDWDPNENDLIVSRDTYITYLGLYFVRICKFE